MNTAKTKRLSTLTITSQRVVYARVWPNEWPNEIITHDDVHVPRGKKALGGRADRPRSMMAVTGKPKVQVAREHLAKAQEEASGGDLRDAVQWAFASLEAAIDALAETRGIAIDEKHWKRTDAAQQLHGEGVLAKDLSGLHRLLNETRKGVIYEGEEPDLGDLLIEDVLVDVEGAVEIAEEAP